MVNRIKYIVVLILTAIGTSGAQSDSLDDVFPLTVGWELRYGFNTSETFTDVGFQKFDTGMVLYSVIDAVSAGDSTRWMFWQVRDFIRTSSPSYIPFAVTDSMRFEVVERLLGAHELYTPDFNPFSAFPFLRDSVDSTSFFRYQPTDSEGVATVSLNLTNGYHSTFTLKNDTGVIQSMGNLWEDFPWGDHIITMRHYLKPDSVAMPVRNDQGLPTECILYQNYPNPFNPKTTFRFDLATQSFVTLRIFDMIGRSITTLVNETIGPGSYERKYDGSDLPSGMYVYKLEAGHIVKSRKFLLLK